MNTLARVGHETGAGSEISGMDPRAGKWKKAKGWEGATGVDRWRWRRYLANWRTRPYRRRKPNMGKRLSVGGEFAT